MDIATTGFAGAGCIASGYKLTNTLFPNFTIQFKQLPDKIMLYDNILEISYVDSSLKYDLWNMDQ